MYKSFENFKQKALEEGFAKGKTFGYAEGETYGFARGETSGLAKGEMMGVRKNILTLLKSKLKYLSKDIVMSIEISSVGELNTIFNEVCLHIDEINNEQIVQTIIQKSRQLHTQES